MKMSQGELGQSTQAIRDELAFAESALSHFGRIHPLHSSVDSEQDFPEIVGYVESEGLLQVSIQRLVDGVNNSSGELKFYLSGLVSGYFYVRTIMASLSKQGLDASKIDIRGSVVAEVNAMCDNQITYLNSRTYSPDLAHAYGIAETAACLLVHLSPKQGGDILDRLYSRH